MNACPKLNPVRDRKYLDWLRTQPCLIDGVCDESVDPAHVGTLGKGIKRGDDECLPIKNKYHSGGHGSGEVSMFREQLPDYIIRDALRAYAREMYRAYVAQATATVKESAAGASHASPSDARRPSAAPKPCQAPTT